METKFRCDCPITSALDLLGDRWILVIIKQMLIQHMQTFKEFSESDEGIASNILSCKLKSLEQNGLIQKINHPSNKKTKIYRLTEMGLALAPIVVELAIWSDAYLRDSNDEMRSSDELKRMKQDKNGAVRVMVKKYREFSVWM